MVTTYSRGNKIYLDVPPNVWRYVEDNSLFDDSKPCKRCGEFPTVEGFDSCLGKLEGVSSACCGHGVSKKIMVMGINEPTMRCK